ncbi:MAG: hypothetical protein E7613_04300 [Ruminococcaceae bacterium]|nr:hypothetical protein [Oscillospiraceae bacterium]
MVSYCTYRNHLAKYDDESYTLTLVHTPTGAKSELVIDGLYLDGEKFIDMTEYAKCSVGHTFDSETPERKMSLTFIPKESEKDLPTFQIFVTVSSRQIKVMFYEMQQYRIVLNGTMVNGDSEDCFAVNLKDTATEAIRCAIGPATSLYDNALYNKKTDSAFCVEGCRDFRMHYDWSKKSYGFRMSTISEGVAEIILFKMKEHILSDKYDIDFVPLKKRGKYDAPPAGWMTWYAVKFDASEEKVLSNARFQSEHLKDFGADTVWVDWEWYHKKYEKERFDGVDCFNPDPKKYPNGLGYVADEIKKCGFIPALWMGFTNDPAMTEYEKEHPEISLAHYETWSGKYYYDITHPEYLNGFLPKAVQQIKDWGYEAVKYDTLPNCIFAHERFHQNMTDPDMTTHEAFVGMIKKTRELLGEDFFMLACGGYVSSILWSAGVFDASRIGPDLFTWEKFVLTIKRLRMYYPLHNIALINDPDNVVLRDEYSNMNQAISRLSIVSLLGLPLTFGDDLPSLPKERVDLLKRALPVMKVHPTDFNNAICDGKTQIICQKIALPFEEYLVTGIMNLTEGELVRDISFKETLRLDVGKYLAYDYFRDEYLGIVEEGIQLDFTPFETRVLALRPLLDRPQIVSTSRHLSQGAAELKNVEWKNNTLKITSALVKGDAYKLTLYIPDDFTFKSTSLGDVEVKGNILTLKFTPDDNREYTFVIEL